MNFNLQLHVRIKVPETLCILLVVKYAYGNLTEKNAINIIVSKYTNNSQVIYIVLTIQISSKHYMHKRLFTIDSPTRFFF